MAKEKNTKLKITRRNVVDRIFRVLDRNELSERYKYLTRTDLENAMISALHIQLTLQLGQEQDFDVYWVDGENGKKDIKCTVYRNYSVFGEESSYDFDISYLGEFRVLQILKHFQKILDDTEAKKAYKMYRTLPGGLVRGKVRSYITKEINPYIKQNFAQIEFYTADNTMIIGTCYDIDLIKNLRSIEKLKSAGTIPFVVADIDYFSEKQQLEVRLSNRTKKLPELLIKESLNEYGFDPQKFRFKCIYREGGKYCKIISIGYIPKEVVEYVKDELAGEIVQIVAIDEPELIPKLDRGLISYKDIEYSQKTIKNDRKKERMKKLKIKAKILDENGITKINDNKSSGSTSSVSVLSRFSKK